MANMNDRISARSMAFVLAGGRGSRLQELTDMRAKPAVSAARPGSSTLPCRTR